MYSNETIQAFLRRARKRLDQELDIETNFWSPAEMLEYANEGVREMWQAVRENHQNWFIRQFTSQDGILTIGGRKYDTSSLRLVAGREQLLLPPDFHELKLFEGVPNPDSAIPGGPAIPAVVLEYANLTQRIFRQGVFDLVTTGVRRYRYDVVYGADGPYIFVAPTLSIEDELNTRIAYIAGPPALTAEGTFEGTGFTDIMVDAVLAYALYCAVRKEDLTENLATFREQWLYKKELASRAAGPKQTRDEETVEGFLEEEL